MQHFLDGIVNDVSLILYLPKQTIYLSKNGVIYSIICDLFSRNSETYLQLCSLQADHPVVAIGAPQSRPGSQ